MSNVKKLEISFLSRGIASGALGLPTLFWGKPGIGKSAIISDFCASRGIPSVILDLSSKDPADIGGLPVPGEEYYTYKLPAWVKTLEESTNSVLFLDEFSNISRGMQAAVMQLVLDRKVGDHYLPRGCRVIAAANPVRQATSGTNLAPAMANRFIHLNWEDPSLDEWSAFLTRGPVQGNRSHLEINVSDLEVNTALVTGRVLGYLRANRQNLHRIPEGNDPKVGLAWPSHRTWDMALKAMACAETLYPQDLDLSLQMLGGCVGEGVAVEYHSFATALDIPDPQEILDGKVAFPFDGRLDLVYVTTTSLVTYVSRTLKKENPQVTTMWEILQKLSETSVDLVLPAIRTLCNHIIQTPACMKALQKTGKDAEEVGVL